MARVEIACQPSYSMAYVYLGHGEKLQVERDGMVSCSAGIDVGGGVGPGGVVKAALRKTLGSETFWMGTYTAAYEGAWVAVAPKFPGDIVAVDLDGSGPLLAESGSVLAVIGEVDVDVRFAGLKAVVLREGATVLRLSGTGTVLLATYGGAQRMQLPTAGHTVVVDTGHLVAWTASCQLQVGAFGGAVTSLTTGEGLVARVEGPGEVVIQTRAEQQLRSWLFPDRAQNSGGHPTG